MSTATWGVAPFVLLALALSLDHVPFTDISLAVPYAAEGPGPTFDTLGEVDGSPVVAIEGADTDDTTGELTMTTVSVRTNMTLVQALGRWVFTDDTLVPIEQIFPTDVSEDDVEEQNRAEFAASEASATVAAMNYLGRPTQVVVAGTVHGSPADGSIRDNDLISAVNGTQVSRPSQVQDAVRALAPGDEVTIRVARGGAEQDIRLTLGTAESDPSVPQLGVYMTSEPADGVTVSYNLNDVGGPSAGMMFSLAVIDKLSPGELNGGAFVAGTGTIEEDGSVGEIGGISHKIEAAREAGAQLFLAPQGNCAEVARSKAGDMVVASVATLDDAVGAMADFNAGREVTTCR